MPVGVDFLLPFLDSCPNAWRLSSLARVDHYSKAGQGPAGRQRICQQLLAQCPRFTAASLTT